MPSCSRIWLRDVHARPVDRDNGRVIRASLLIVGSVGLALGASGIKAEELEKIPAGEQQAIKTIVPLALAELAKRYPPGAPLVRRDAHAKSHGCAKALLRVDADIPADLRVGLLSRPGQDYRAWVRFSNAAFEPGPDTRLDARGMAVKIMSAAAPAEPSSGAAAAHDLLLVNHPVFLSPDAIDYVDIHTAGALAGNWRGLRRYLLPSLNPWRWRLGQALIAYRMASGTISSPLAAQYYSIAPFLFGPGRAVKYSARPCASAAGDRPGAAEVSGADFLKAALQDELSRGAACFELLVQERRGAMPIEDATVEWSQAESPFRRVGTLELPRQRLDGDERAAFCENISFNPGNAPPDHRPLGSLNRVRPIVYKEISTYRQGRNKLPAPDPVEAWNRL